MGAFGLWSLVYLISFQIRQIPAKNHLFPRNNNAVSIKLTVPRLQIPKNKFFQFEISLPQASKQKET